MGHPSEPAARRRPPPGEAAAGVTAAVLGLWIPFTVIVGLLVAAEPDCTSSRAAICTPLGHLASVCAGTLGALFGLGILVVGCWVHPRRDHAYWVVVGLTVAAVGFLTMIALLNGARAGH